MSTTLVGLKTAGMQRIDAAREALGDRGGRPQVACYLLHVGLECLFKARIMRIRGKTNTEALREVMREDEFYTLFFGRTGHELGRLAESASLKRLLELEDNMPLAPTRGGFLAGGARTWW